MIYDRQVDFPQELYDIKSSIDEIKSTQRVGNDNLVVASYDDTLMGPISVPTTGAKFRAEFTFDQPSNSLVLITFDWIWSGTGQFNKFSRTDPSTVASNTTQAAILELIPQFASTLTYVSASAVSTQTGTIELTRI